METQEETLSTGWTDAQCQAKENGTRGIISGRKRCPAVWSGSPRGRNWAKQLQPSVEEQQISQELEVETESGGEESIAAGTSVVTDTSMIHSESEPEGELDPQDVSDECLKTVDRKMLATCLFQKRNNECHGCCTRSCLDNWFQWENSACLCEGIQRQQLLIQGDTTGEIWAHVHLEWWRSTWKSEWVCSGKCVQEGRAEHDVRQFFEVC